MSIDVRASGNDLELWHVQSGGAVRTMTLDELDAAFQAGTIDERTMVLKAGSLNWTTLGDVAGIDDQPNSIAPMATDIVSSNLVMPRVPEPKFDVTFGTEELAVFAPKRRVGRGLFAASVFLLFCGAVIGAISHTDDIKAKLASVTSLVKGQNAESARAAAGAPLPAAEPTAAPVSPPPAPIESLPAAKPTAAGVSIDSLPSASPATEKADNKGKKTADPAPKKKRATGTTKAKSKASSDPTDKGSDQFDPLNGHL